MKKIIIGPKENIASFDVDCQNTFTPICPDELPVTDGHLIVDELNQQAKFAILRVGSKDAHSPKAIWVADQDHPQYSSIITANTDVRWRLHAVPGTKGFELIDGLPTIPEYDYFIWKGVELDMHPYGACYHDFAERMSTGVIEFLRAKNITTIIVGGLATDYCVKNTVLQLCKADFKVIVNLAACRGIAEDTIYTAQQSMQTAGAILINSSAELCHSS